MDTRIPGVPNLKSTESKVGIEEDGANLCIPLSSVVIRADKPTAHSGRRLLEGEAVWHGRKSMGSSNSFTNLDSGVSSARAIERCISLLCVFFFFIYTIEIITSIPWGGSVGYKKLG